MLVFFTDISMAFKRNSFEANSSLNNLVDYYEECVMVFNNGQLHILNLIGEAHLYK